ncbi:MAG: tRNA lysidine(34) synthetase TilS [Rhodobacteraceae bacterium]|nr:tRNA lysidine(34) synthetase TilS [Paracoccaceae bacterium]
MLKILGNIPKTCCVAVSGGLDSMAVLDFLSSSRDVIAIHYNHGTPFANSAEQLVRDYCANKDIPLVVDNLCEEMPRGVSKEAWWREKRYTFFDNASKNKTLKVVMAHHLDDAVENWIFTSLNGNPFLIPHSRENYLRPFISTRKSVFEQWCIRKNVPYINDPSNQDIRFRRNYIRHKLMPLALDVNPGLHKVIKKKYENVKY